MKTMQEYENKLDSEKTNLKLTLEKIKDRKNTFQ